MRKMVLFNAPAKVGKDVVIKYLQENGINLYYAECKTKLHKLVQEIFNVSFNRYWDIYNNRSLKEIPLDDFRVNFKSKEDRKVFSDLLPIDWLDEKRHPSILINGKIWKVNLSIREAMIYVSEVLIKPRFGEDYFGKSRMLSMKNEGVYVDGSAAFIDELNPLIDELGQENILLIRVYRDGYTFDGDSRGYIPDGIITNTVDVDNNGTEQEYFNKVKLIVEEFIGE